MRDVGGDEQFGNLVHERHGALLHGGGLGVETVIEEVFFLPRERFEGGKEPADDLVRSLHESGRSGNTAGVLLAFDFVFAEHFGPSVAELADEGFDLDHGFDLFLHVGLKEAAHVVFVEAVEIGGMIATDLVVEAGLKFGEDILRFNEIGTDDLDPTRGPLGGLERVVGMAEETKSAVVKHQYELAGAGGKYRLRLIGTGVALGHMGWHVEAENKLGVA